MEQTSLLDGRPNTSELMHKWLNGLNIGLRWGELGLNSHLAMKLIGSLGTVIPGVFVNATGSAQTDR